MCFYYLNQQATKLIHVINMLTCRCLCQDSELKYQQKTFDGILYNILFNVLKWFVEINL